MFIEENVLIIPLKYWKQYLNLWKIPHSAFKKCVALQSKMPDGCYKTDVGQSLKGKLAWKNSSKNVPKWLCYVSVQVDDQTKYGL